MSLFWKVACFDRVARWGLSLIPHRVGQRLAPWLARVQSRSRGRTLVSHTGPRVRFSLKKSVKYSQNSKLAKHFSEIVVCFSTVWCFVMHVAHSFRSFRFFLANALHRYTSLCTRLWGLCLFFSKLHNCTWTCTRCTWCSCTRWGLAMCCNLLRLRMQNNLEQ